MNIHKATALCRHSLGSGPTLVLLAGWQLLWVLQAATWCACLGSRPLPPPAAPESEVLCLQKLRLCPGSCPGACCPAGAPLPLWACLPHITAQSLSEGQLVLPGGSFQTEGFRSTTPRYPGVGILAATAPCHPPSCLHVPAPSPGPFLQLPRQPAPGCWGGGLGPRADSLSAC